jgi:hypothetical protein
MADRRISEGLQNFSGETEATLDTKTSQKMSYFIFRSLKMTKQNMLRCTTIALLLSIFTERYCFIVTVYKMKFYGYVLIMTVIALNCIFNTILSGMRI